MENVKTNFYGEPIFTEIDLPRFQTDDDGYILCPSGDYTEIGVFPSRCKFDDRCRFRRSDVTFGSECVFGAFCQFGEDFQFGNACRFEKGGSFDSYSVFNKGCIFYPSLRKEVYHD